MDYGPFSTHDVHELIKKHEIDGQTELFNLRHKERKPLDRWPSFARYRAEFLKQEAEEKKRLEVLHEVSRLERVVKRQRRMPWAVVAGLAVAGGVIAYFVFRPPTPVLAGYPSSYFRDLAFERLAPVTEADLAALRPAPKVEEVKVAPKARPRVASGAQGGTLELDRATPIEVDLTDEPADSGGRQIASEDLDRVQKKVSPGLIRCFREEAERRPGFEGGSVLLYVMANGDVRVSRLATRPHASADLGRCARGAVAGLRVPPFSGPAQVMDIPIYVSSMR
jgi:hypothetical protein